MQFINKIPGASIHPIIRGILIAGAGFLAVEMIKPSFAFMDVGGGNYLARQFKQDMIIDENEELIMKGTNFPWWAVPLALFIVFGFII